MSFRIPRPARLNTATRTRLLMAGTVTGASLTLALSMQFGSLTTSADPNDHDPAGDDSVLTQDDQARSTFSADVGACLIWEEANGTDMREVGCRRPHLFEVTEVLDVSDEFDDHAPPPDIDEWRAIAEQRCTEGTGEYLGTPLDPNGKLSVTALLPQQQSWEDGDREVRCGLWWAVGPAGTLQRLNKPAAEIDQSDVWPAGTCLGIVESAAADPVACAAKHSYEIIAVVDLSKKFDDGFPSEQDQQEWLDEKCSDLADDYTDGLNLEKKDLGLAWDTRSKASWKAGSHLVNCMVGAVLDDESGLAPVMGSVAEGANDDLKVDTKPGG